jgi:hypothetical protein
METPLPPDFKEFLALLNSEKVEYLVVGGYAVSYYGYPRPTGDLDVWIAVDIENARRIRTALDRFGFAQGATRPEDFAVPNKIFRMGVPPVRIEVLTGATGVDFADCHRRRVEAELDGVRVSMIARVDLLNNKRAAGRHKDLNDIEHLEGGPPPTG